MEDIAIRVDHVSKDFILPHEKITSVKTAFTHIYKLAAYHKVRETQHALREVTIEVKRGEFFGIVGRNGSGKSTLLKILAGIYQPTKGRVTVRGKLVPFIELGVGFNPELTGRENVYLNGAMLGFSRREINGMYGDIVAFAELERFMDQKLKNYSSGMQVRLAFSMATRSQADILLVDEVLAVGDADFQRKCFDYFKTLKKDKRTVVFVTHDMNAVREYCDRAILIDDSKVVVEGNPDEVATAYTRQFNISASSDSGRAQVSRWGNGNLQIMAPKALLAADRKNVIVDFKIVAKHSIENPIVGFVIKDARGVGLVGTNTRLLSRKLGTLKSGECVSFEFNIQNMFNDGRYSIDLAVTASDGVTVADWWEGAASLKVFREQISPYLTSPEVEVTISKQGKADAHIQKQEAN